MAIISHQGGPPFIPGFAFQGRKSFRSRAAPDRAVVGVSGEGHPPLASGCIYKCARRISRGDKDLTNGRGKGEQIGRGPGHGYGGQLNEQEGRVSGRMILRMLPNGSKDKGTSWPFLPPFREPLWGILWGIKKKG